MTTLGGSPAARTGPAPFAAARETGHGACAQEAPAQFTPTSTQETVHALDPDVLEAERLAELHSLNILDTPSEPGFDSLVELASQVTGCPIALVSLLDEQRQ